jgi:hypothetical protein
MLEIEVVRQAKAGSPQGGVISPMLSNVYLHYVLDVWFEKEVKPRMKGRAFLVRFADDFVMGFEREDDARRVLDVLPKRFGKYGLALQPTKTRLVRFTRPPRQDPPKGEDSGQGPGSFDLAGNRPGLPDHPPAANRPTCSTPCCGGGPMSVPTRPLRLFRARILVDISSKPRYHGQFPYLLLLRPARCGQARSGPEMREKEPLPWLSGPSPQPGVQGRTGVVREDTTVEGR